MERVPNSYQRFSLLQPKPNKIIPLYSQKKKIHFMPKVFSVQLIWVCIPNVLRLDTWSKTINSTVIYNVWVPQMAINELKADATHFDWTTTELLWTTTELLRFQKNKHHFTEVSISMLLSIKTWFNAWAQHILILVGFEVVFLSHLAIFNRAINACVRL